MTIYNGNADDNNDNIYNNDNRNINDDVDNGY